MAISLKNILSASTLNVTPSPFSIGNTTNIVSCISGTGGTGTDNFFAGCEAGFYNTTGKHNNFFGCGAGRCNTSGNYNNFFGRTAGRCNTTGCYNFFVGPSSGDGNTTGNHNMFIGQAAGYKNTNGCNNTFIGCNAGRENTTGSNNIFFGLNSGTITVLPDGLANITTESNRIVMGNCAHTCAQIKIAWTVVSDCRDKCIFGTVPLGRGFLQNLETVEYAFKDRDTGCITDPEGKRRYGFSAQNVLAAEGSSPVIVSTEDEEKLQLTSDYLIPVLVNAVNELSQESNAMAAEIADLKTRLAALEAR